MSAYHNSMNDLLNLPDCILEKILSYMTFDEIARQRLVCQKFDQTCKQLLNRGFVSVERYHRACLKSVKAQLPRRESERRVHPMFRHCEILNAVETRLSMLSMTFMKYVEIKFCCFIPGKVIDEIFRVLRHVMTSTTQLRAHEILQELRDISSMAMEHFDEKIAPRLKQQLDNQGTRTMHPMSISAASNLGILPSSTRSITPDKATLVASHFSKMQSRSKVLKKSVKHLYLKLKRHSAQLSRQNARLREQAQKLREQDTVIAELKRHLQEWDHVLGELKGGRLMPGDVDATDPTVNSIATLTSSACTSSSTSHPASDKSTIDSGATSCKVEADIQNNGTESKINAPKLKRSAYDASTSAERFDPEVPRKRLCRVTKICEEESVIKNDT